MKMKKISNERVELIRQWMTIRVEIEKYRTEILSMQKNIEVLEQSICTIEKLLNE
jgi:hypothetical protein